ncbi:MAG: hypothetical protein V1853_02005 [bacterium]
MRDKIIAALTQALSGSRKVSITFKPEALLYIGYLLVMIKAKTVQIDNKDEIKLKAVLVSRKWNMNCPRTVTITLTDAFNQKWFIRRLGNALEAISVVNEEQKPKT